MKKVKVLVEMDSQTPEAFAVHRATVTATAEAFEAPEALAAHLAGVGLEVEADYAPVPMFSRGKPNTFVLEALTAFSSPKTNPDMTAETMVVAAEVDKSKIDALRTKPGVVGVWPNSTISLLDRGCGCSCSCQSRPAARREPPDDDPLLEDLEALLDEAPSAGGVDCRPFRAGVRRSRIRALLGVVRLWERGFRGQNIIVGIIDEGVNGTTYPVVGGFTAPNAPSPGSADITSHGSMCAADILVGAPLARLYDYPFLGVPNSGGALRMFQAVLDQRRIDGTPHLTNNSYGFVGRPTQAQAPHHEVWDINHPVHRKVREVIASGAPAFFAAGNCGEDCPSGNCQASGIGPGKSIHASNSLPEVITVAAVNSRHERIGYSSQGPGGFDPQKPDIASYSHFFGNFGPDRPGGLDQPFDNGTSAATPVAAGVGALLMSSIPGLTPAGLKQALMQSATNIGPPGWDRDTGQGVINAAAAYEWLRNHPNVV